nr:AAA family ATPase [Actinomycetota bacterium]
EDALDDARHARALRGGRYASLVATAAANLRVGLGVVLVAPFSDELREEDAWSALASRLAARTVLCYVDAPDDLLLARLASRGAPRDAAKLAAPEVFASTRAAVRPAVEHVRVDGTRPVEEEVDRVRRALGLGRDEHGRCPDGTVAVPC